MNELLLGGELALNVSEGFRIMDDAERSGLSPLAGGEWTGLSDPDRHMIVTLGWKRTGGFAAALLSERDLAKGMEKKIRKPMRPFGYRLESFSERTIAGARAGGLRYSYEVQDTAMTGESWALKRGKTFFYFHAYMRSSLLEESLPVWNALLDSAGFLQEEKG